MAKKVEKKTLGLNIKLSTDTIQKLSESETITDKEDGLTPPIKDTESVPASDTEVSENVTQNTEEDDKTPPAQTESKHSNEYSKYIHYEGSQAVYTDPQTGCRYIWCLTSNSWVAKPESEVEQPQYGFENDKHTYTDTDGAKYVWDSKKNAWFPNVDDDFLAKYQMSYGFVDNASKSDSNECKDNEKEVLLKDAAAAAKRKAAQAPEWFDVDDDHNTKVYVSNLPSDVTEEEFVDLMQKCGLVMRDLKTQKMNVKLYKDKESNLFKGDALCCYIKIESVQLALNIIDGSELRGHTLKVERAQFQMKGDYDPSLKPKKKKKDKEKMKRNQEKLFDWRPEKIQGEPAKHERVVIIKNLFEPTLFDDHVHLLLEYQEDLRKECAKLGEVRKVTLFDRHPHGVAQVNMKDSEEASKVVTLMDGRWFGKRQLIAQIWDGRTKYRIAETDSQISERIGGWEEFLGADKSASEAEEVDTEKQLDIKQN